MWKCFNRGVWETIDLSVNAFKADTSNGTCLISSLAKDFDGKSEESVRCKYKQYGQDRGEGNRESVDLNVPRENRLQKLRSNRPGLSHGHVRASEVQSRQQLHLKAVKVTKGLDVIPKPFICGAVKKIPQTGCHLAHDVTNSCVERTIHGKCEVTCSCDRKQSPDFDQISESNLLEGRGYLFRNESSKPNIYKKLLSNPLSGNVGSPEERSGLKSLYSKLNAAGSHKGNLFSFFGKITKFRDSQGVNRENVGSPHETNQPHDVVHSNSHAKSNCVLKLPFLCYDLGRFKGLSNVSVGWLLNARNDFRSGDSGKTSGGERGESEETNEETWRDCHMHQSLLEAIGWSSAVLLGWFLGQCRFRHIYGELQRDNSLEHERKCCIIRSLSKFLVTWRGDSALPLKVQPGKTDSNIPKESRKKEGGKVHGEEITPVVDPYDTNSPNPLTLLNGGEDCISERHSPLNYLKLFEDEGSFSHEVHLKRKSHDAEEAQKNVIPLPWPEVSDENLVYGPVTFEEAIMEAGKGLEEAQSEVLLTLALEKLNKECTQSEPLPADLFQSAASLGNSAAAFNLGICYEKGVGGVVKNLAKAYQWYKQASEKGHAAATYNMAVFHANGLGGLYPNTYLANQLLLRASSLGLEEATIALHLISSSNNSDISHIDGQSSASVSQDSLNIDIEENGYPLKNHMSKSCSSMVVKSGRGHKGVYGNSYGESSNDLSAVSQPSSYFTKLSKMSSLKLGEALINSISLNNSVGASRQSMEEVVSDDHHCIKNGCVHNASVQLLAH